MDQITSTAARERFIPLAKSDVIKACINHGNLAHHEEDAAAFSQVCQLISQLTHYRFQFQLESLKTHYTPFDHSADTLTPFPLSVAETEAAGKAFAEEFAALLNHANFSRVTEADLQQALQERSLFNVRLAVKFEDFEEVVFYRRGESTRTETLTTWFGLRKQDIAFTNYDKVAVFIKFKSADYFAQQGREDLNFVPGSTVIKLFQNVPKADLEMLFPNSEIKMRPIDKAIIGGSAVIGGGVMLATKLGGTLLLLSALFAYWLGLSDQEVSIGQKELLALAAGFGVLGGFIFKEWSKFKNRKLKFMQALSENLYFKNLSNNAGVFHHLLDAAEEEECKEAILAYYFLQASQQGLSAKELDKLIESWFQTQFNHDMDFEVGDALAKLLLFGLVKENPPQHHMPKAHSVYQAINFNDALVKLDAIWDNAYSV